MSLKVNPVNMVDLQARGGPAKAGALQRSPFDTQALQAPSGSGAARESVESDGKENMSVSGESAQKIVREMNSAFAVLNTRISFGVIEELDKVVIRVIDNETNKVLRQIPPEELVQVMVRMRELVGLLIDERV